MKDIISAIETATSLPVKPFGTKTIENCIVYKFNTVTDNGIVAQIRLELNIITKTIAEAASIEAAIKSALVTVGDTKKIAGFNSAAVNGGGTLFNEDTQTVHTILYIILTKKSEV